MLNYTNDRIIILIYANLEHGRSMKSEDRTDKEYLTYL